MTAKTRQEEHEAQRAAEIAKGREIAERLQAEQEQLVARNFLSKSFNDKHVEATEGLPGNKVSDYNLQMWARNKNREDFK